VAYPLNSSPQKDCYTLNWSLSLEVPLERLLAALAMVKAVSKPGVILRALVKNLPAADVTLSDPATMLQLSFSSTMSLRTPEPSSNRFKPAWRIGIKTKGVLVRTPFVTRHTNGTTLLDVQLP